MESEIMGVIDKIGRWRWVDKREEDKREERPYSILSERWG